MCQRRLTILKLGGSVLRDETSLQTAVHEIYQRVRAGDRVVAVVSALGGETDQLFTLARRHGAKTPLPAATALLASTGEHRSAALLALALDRDGVTADVLDAGALDLAADGPALDAHPRDVNGAAVTAALERADVVVVPGFVGRDPAGRTVLLGRGGSDLTAFFLAVALDADRCCLVKDVDGLYEFDPARTGPERPRRYATLSWDDALRLDGTIVQHKAVRYAREHGLSFEVAGPLGGPGSLVGPGPVCYADGDGAPIAPVSVTLLGLGTVGGGVYEALAGLPHLARVRRVVVRNPNRAIAAGVPTSLIGTDAPEAADEEADVVIEALGGVDPAAESIERALRRGATVISANKAALAAHGPRLERLAACTGGTLRWSAAAGGAMPILETVERLARSPGIRSIEGILNGTTNAVLDLASDGATVDEAIEAAGDAGFAEADPTRDLSGADAADKLALVHRAWTGRWIAPDNVDVAASDLRGAIATASPGHMVRQVAALHARDGALTASVRLRHLPAEHPLASIPGELNAAIITTATGERIVLRGRGAGGRPTAASVIGDLVDDCRERARHGRTSRDTEALAVSA